MIASILAQSVRIYCNVLKAMFLNKILMHGKKKKKKSQMDHTQSQMDQMHKIWEKSARGFASGQTMRENAPSLRGGGWGEIS